MSATTWSRYAALGDSITEGWCDPVLGNGDVWFGWADRLALLLDAQLRPTGRRLEFANLAVRGRRVRHVVEDQIPEALAMRADLVSILIGGNDLLSLRTDLDALAARIEDGVVQLRKAGIDVLLGSAIDPGPGWMMRPFRGRSAVFAAHMASIAARHHCMLLDVWGIRAFAEPSARAEDRMHPSTRGHLMLLRAATEALGIPAPSGDDLPQASTSVPTTVWMRRHLLPFLGRKLRGVSSGDGRAPKLPVPILLGGVSDAAISHPGAAHLVADRDAAQ